MNFGLNGKNLLTVCFLIFGMEAAFSQTSDSNSVHAIDTLSFDQISNENTYTPPAANPSANPSPSDNSTTAPANGSQPAGNNGSQQTPAQSVNGGAPEGNPSSAQGSSPANTVPAGTTPSNTSQEGASPANTTPENTTPANASNPANSTPASTSPANTASGTPSDTLGLPASGNGTPASASSSASSDEPVNKSKQRAFAGFNRFRPFSLGIDLGGAIFGGPGVNDYRVAKMAGGASFFGSYALGRAFALEGNIHYQSPMQGSSLRADSAGIPHPNVEYKISTLDFSLNAVFSLGNINFISKKNKWMIYGSVGAGMVTYTTELTEKEGDITATVKKSGSAIIIPVGGGVKYKINNDLTMRAGYVMKFADSDKLDNTLSNGNADKYAYGYIGFTYAIGNKKKPSLEWNNAALAMYDDLSGSDRINPLKKKISSMQEELDSMNVNFKSKLDSLKNDMKNLANNGAGTSMGAGMVDANGKALDSDGDGIPDMYDRCPFEKGSQAFGGCPKRSVKAGKKDQSAVKDAENKIFFDKNSGKLNEEAYKALDNLASVMEKNAGYKLLISGYTDADGDKALNERLSAERATAVKEYLVKKGVAESRLKSEGLGEKVFLDNNITSAGKRNNRVVTLEFVTY